MSREKSVEMIFNIRFLYFVRLDVVSSEWEYRWGDMNEFTQLLISPFMMRHHLPQVVFAALEDVAQQVASPS